MLFRVLKTSPCKNPQCGSREYDVIGESTVRCRRCHTWRSINADKEACAEPIIPDAFGKWELVGMRLRRFCSCGGVCVVVTWDGSSDNGQIIRRYKCKKCLKTHKAILGDTGKGLAPV